MHHRPEHTRDVAKVDSFPLHFADLAFDDFPGLDAIEDLEEHRAKEEFWRRLRSVGPILHLSDKILANAI